MPRVRVVDPFATKRIGRPAPDGPTPPPETPGELARRMAKAMRARIDAVTVEGDTAEDLGVTIPLGGGGGGAGTVTAGQAGGGAGGGSGTVGFASGGGATATTAREPQEAPAAPDASVAAEPVPEPGSEPQGPEGEGLGDALAGWLTASEAAEVLQVDPAEVRRRCREGELDAAKDGTGAWRINPAALTAP